MSKQTRRARVERLRAAKARKADVNGGGGGDRQLPGSSTGSRSTARRRQWPAAAPAFQCAPEAHPQWLAADLAFLLAYGFWTAVFECLIPPTPGKQNH